MTAMEPVRLETRRLVLDQPTLDDVDLISEYCSDPLFESYLTTPWPYRRRDAVGFVGAFVPTGWSTGREYTWAIRRDGAFLGVVGWRVSGRDIGFWLGAPHRGAGYMTEAVDAVTTWLFGQRGVDGILWECIAGNVASASVARKAGFRYLGVAPTGAPTRDGSHPSAWHGELRARGDSAADAAARASWSAVLPATNAAPPSSPAPNEYEGERAR